MAITVHLTPGAQVTICHTVGQPAIRIPGSNRRQKRSRRITVLPVIGGGPFSHWVADIQPHADSGTMEAKS